MLNLGYSTNFPPLFPVTTSKSANVINKTRTSAMPFGPLFTKFK